MSKLIALVATAVMVNGVRTVVQPGEPLPDLPEHDERALVDTGAAQDAAAAAREAKAADRADDRALDDFRQAREQVQAAAASIAPPPAQQEPAKPAGKKS